MYFCLLQSDQLYTWSDKSAEQVHRHIAQTSRSSSAPTASAQGDPARFADRALQALRQTGMQMRRGSWSWPQILFIGKPLRLTSSNGLRAAGAIRTGHRVCRQLPPSPRDLRGDLRNQSRAAAPPGGALITGRHERGTLRPSRLSRCGNGRCASRQYARGLARRRSRRSGNRGGSQ